MKKNITLSCSLNELLTKIDTHVQEPCLLLGRGHGFVDTLAWNPAARLTLDSLSTKEDIVAFVQKQTGLGRKIIGYLSYDLGYCLHGLKQTKPNDIDMPLGQFLSYENYITSDVNLTTAYFNDASLLDDVKGYSQIRLKGVDEPTIDEPFAPISGRSWYSSAFNRIKEYIVNGYVYQINLTHRLEARSKASGPDIFNSLCLDNPAGFMAYLSVPGGEILSTSPERFVKIQDGTVQTFPIKGTRKHSSSTQSALASGDDLLMNKKESAELNMITDLLRNDVGKISKIGSVKVLNERLLLEQPGIIHTYSHIQGALRSDLTPIEAFLSMFPGGSITGCPKHEAMKIIDELEPVNRGPYCGSVVSIDPNGDLDSSILIRTIIKKDDRLILPVGGGIVYDSNENEEYQETLDKAASVTRFL